MNTGQPLAADVTIANHDDNFSTVSSHLPSGDYHRPIKGGTYDVTYSCSGYHPQTVTITVADGETVTQNIQLEADGTLAPDFNANRTNISPSESINFNDNTWGAYLVSWEWTFEGGDPATSNEQNPRGITYSQNGTYDVTLTVTNSNGQTETITKQNYITVSEAYTMQNGTITTCNAMFYDDGGPDGNYRDRKNYAMTFLPTSPDRKISAEFTSFNTEAEYDYLYIYDGTSTSAPLIGSYDGNNSPGTVIATNNEGALTFRFTSDQAVNTSGWSAAITCVEDWSLNEHGFVPQIYPNPNNGCFTINAVGKINYRLFNSIGQQVISGQGEGKTIIDATSLSQGVYFLQLTGDCTQFEKVIIEK